MKLVQRVFSSVAFWLLCAFAVAAAEPTDAQKEAMAAVERAHPDWREVDASAEFKKWIARQPQEVLDLGRGWAPNDIIRMLDLYKKDMVRLEPIVGTFEEGWTASERGDYSKALRIWRPLAARGDDWAQYNVGVLYQHGRSVPKDEVRAVYWFNMAAVQGNVTAQQGLYRMYRSGTGAPKDDVKATYWLRKAADGGQVDAQFLLADKYDKGEDVPKSSSEAAYWWRKAAEQGHALAQYELASRYKEGNGVPKNVAEAARWWRKSAEQGNLSAQILLGQAYEDGEGVTKDYRTAFDWYLKAAKQGAKGTQVAVGTMLADGLGVPKDDEAAYFWLLLGSVDGEDFFIRARDTVERRLSASQRTSAQAKAREWKPVSSEATVTDAPTAPQAIGVGATRTGTGFRVLAGRIVTNAHVVDDCSRLRVGGRFVASVLTQDAKNDIAMLSVQDDAGPVVNVRMTRPKLGETVTVAGFPLQRLLTGLSVTHGSISRLSGLGGDSRLLQISAPVQPGNSGGPLLDASGDVIGVVVSKLDAVRVANATGDIPQNVNFALSASVLRAFLDANGIAYRESSAERPLPAAEVASRAARFTVLVECWK